MSLAELSSRAIVGRYYERLEAKPGMEWIDAISNYFTSDQESETYKWLGMPPALREWVGGRHAKGFNVSGITIENKHYEGTLEIMLKDLRRDKTGQIMVRVDEFAARANTHWASLLSTLMLNGPSSACYDGQYFFDTDHSEGESGSQSNDISVDISGLAVSNHGSVVAPSVAEMALTIMQGVQAIYGFKDDRGEPLNEGAQQFIVAVPVPLFNVAAAACFNQVIDGNDTNPLAAQNNFRVRPLANPRLTWTDSFAIFRADGSVKAFIRQEEQGIITKVKDENSEYAFDNDAIQIGVDTWRNVGYGRWQGAVYVTMI